MYLRMTDLLVDLLDRYEPDMGAEDPGEVVSEEPAGVAAYGQWTLLADEDLADVEDVRALIERLHLADDEEFGLAEGVLSFNADGVPPEEILALIEAVDAAADLLEVSGELDVHERSITWMGEAPSLEPMPMPVPRPDDEIPLLVEEVAIHLQRHEARPAEAKGRGSVLSNGIELFGRPYLLLRDEVESVGDVEKALASAGVPPAEEIKSHRVEWAPDVLRPSHVYAAVHALKPLNPVVGLAGGFTWRNETVEVEESNP